MKSLNRGRVVVCRGCCCGVATTRLNGAEERLNRLLSLEEHGFEVSTSECLGPCSDGDFVVFIPIRLQTESKNGRNSANAQNKPIWFKGMHVNTLNNLLIDWILQRGEGFEGEYKLLKDQVFTPNTKNRKAINERISS
jgi:hypothetical protein